MQTATTATSSWDWTSFASGLLGVVIGAAASLLAMWLSNRGAAERDAKTYARALREAKAERLRDLYIQATRMATALQYVAHERTFLMDGETAEARDARLDAVVGDAGRDLDRVWSALLLEEDAQAVVEALHAASLASFRLNSSRRLNAEHHGLIQMSEIQAEETQLRDSVDAVMSAAREHLSSLSAPI